MPTNLKLLARVMCGIMAVHTGRPQHASLYLATLKSDKIFRRQALHNPKIALAYKQRIAEQP